MVRRRVKYPGTMLSRGTLLAAYATIWEYPGTQAFSQLGKDDLLKHRGLLTSGFFAAVLEKLMKCLKHHLSCFFDGFALRISSGNFGDICAETTFLGWFKDKRDRLHSLHYTPSKFGC